MYLLAVLWQLSTPTVRPELSKSLLIHYIKDAAK